MLRLRQKAQELLRNDPSAIEDFVVEVAEDRLIELLGGNDAVDWNPAIDAPDRKGDPIHERLRRYGEYREEDIKDPNAVVQDDPE